MKDILNPIDFFFNGHWLSEFGGTIVREHISSNINMLPQKETITESVLGLDGDVFIKSKYQPRYFTILTKFENMKVIREIASWLGTKEPSYFYYKGDSIKIKTTIDNVVDVELYGYEGLVELNFVAYDPYYYAIEDKVFTFTNNLQQIEVYNESNCESYPLYKISGKGTITIGINGKETFRVKLNSTGNDYIYVDTYNCVYYKGDTNRINDFEGYSNVIPSGKVLFSIVGECTEFEVNCRSRWI